MAIPLLERAARGKVEGLIGGPDPFDAVEHAVHEGDFDEIMVSTLPKQRSKWLRRDLIRRVEALGLPVTAVMPRRGRWSTPPETWRTRRERSSARAGAADRAQRRLGLSPLGREDPQACRQPVERPVRILHVNFGGVGIGHASNGKMHRDARSPLGRPLAVRRWRSRRDRGPQLGSTARLLQLTGASTRGGNTSFVRHPRRRAPVAHGGAGPRALRHRP